MELVLMVLLVPAEMQSKYYKTQQATSKFNANSSSMVKNQVAWPFHTSDCIRVMIVNWSTRF